jgi:hypothetical protein
VLGVQERVHQSSNSISFQPEVANQCTREVQTFCQSPTIKGPAVLDCLIDHRWAECCCCCRPKKRSSAVAGASDRGLLLWLDVGIVAAAMYGDVVLQAATQGAATCSTFWERAAAALYKKNFYSLLIIIKE